MDPIDLGKMPVLATPPVKAPDVDQKKIEDGERSAILAFTHTHGATEGSGATYDDMLEHMLEWAEEHPQCARKAQRISIVREHVRLLERSNQVVRLNPGKNPHRFGPKKRQFTNAT